ncbi:MAG TPA: hypothetical protein VFM70_04710 [Salinimicrobium sp.]|nr:hypothetical protein [Salinimicrobium sp.]
MGFSQDQDFQRIQSIRNQLIALSVENPGLTENVKTDISVNNISLANFLLAISDVHNININVSPELNQITIANNFSNVTVADLLVFLSKEYGLEIDFTGNILSVKKYQAPPELPAEKIIPIVYFPQSDKISIDAKGDRLYDVFKKIIDETGKNLVFSPGLENKLLTAYIRETDFDAAMDKLAFSNNLYVVKTKDNFYLFESAAIPGIADQNGQQGQRPQRRRSSDFHFEILDVERKLLEVDFVNTPIADIVHDIGNELDIDIFTATPLDNAGTVTFNATAITFDELLRVLFESQSTAVGTNTPTVQGVGTGAATTGSGFTFKKEDNIYFFGTKDQLSVRKVEIVHLQHRSVELLTAPSGGGQMANRNINGNFTSANYPYNNTNQFDSFSYPNRQEVNTNQNGSFNNFNNKAEALLSILPDEIKQNLDIKVDYELNSFYVNGSSEKIERFKEFISRIDKPVPVILIEVMFIEISKGATVETGVTWGIGDAPAETKGNLFPTTEMTLSATTINKILGNFNGFGSFTIGKVVPNFFATIKAMESNGNLKIKSTPKLSTLNGHQATFSNGQTSYYAVTQRNIYGTDNPQTSEITNYVPIEAQLGLTIKPIVSGDGQVTLDIFVIQSAFGTRIAPDAPPDINSREFNSIIRVADQDIVVLGGLEEQVKDDSGTGVPLLARIPIIKWLFSSRKREDSKSKLTVLIKPTIIY